LKRAWLPKGRRRKQKVVAKLSTIRRKIRSGEKMGFSERARAVSKGLIPSAAKKRKKSKNRKRKHSQA
jgi:hypothetical protein